MRILYDSIAVLLPSNCERRMLAECACAVCTGHGGHGGTSGRARGKESGATWQGMLGGPIMWGGVIMCTGWGGGALGNA